MDRFVFESDQIFAFWVSMLSGASAYCGIWNVGDGNFLAHWGRRTFREAKKPTVPLKIVKSNKLFYVLRVLYRRI